MRDPSLFAKSIVHCFDMSDNLSNGHDGGDSIPEKCPSLISCKGQTLCSRGQPHSVPADSNL